MIISIAMATYNGAFYLPEQLESFVAQEVRPDELVVCDDGSTDKTIRLLEEFRAGAPFKVRISRNEARLGYGRNFARALGLCTGDIVFLSDQDDVWYPEKIATMVRLAEENPHAQVLLNDAMLTDARLNPSGRTKLGQMRAAGLPEKSFVQGCCAAIRASFLRMALPLPLGSGAHDGWLVELAEFLGAKLVLRRDLQFYRIHGSNTSRFHVNHPEGGRLYRKLHLRLGRTARAALRSELQAELEKLAAIRARLEGADPLPGRSHADLERALVTLAEKKAATHRRLAVLASPPGIRFGRGLRMLMDGAYARHFNGRHSFVRDMLS